MDESTTLFLLFFELLTSWSKIVISVLIAILIRHRAIGARLG